MNIGNALAEGVKILKAAKIEAPVVDAGVILCYILGCDRTFLYAHGEDELEEGLLPVYIDAINKMSGGMPVQYITGHQEFMSIDFIVTQDVLIPRHDTEILVEAVLEYAKTRVGNEGSVLNILDLGTGSGCIAVSIARYLERCSITGADISKNALDIARVNAVNAGVSEKICFTRSDLFKNLAGCSYDIIVSNPPYIPGHELECLQREVKDFEPRTALYGGRDGLDFYKNIIRLSPQYLNRKSMLAFETGYNQAMAVAEMMSGCFSDIKVLEDLGGIPRVVTGILSGHNSV